MEEQLLPNRVFATIILAGSLILTACTVGSVKDSTTGASVPNAHIVWTDSAGNTGTVETDGDGLFGISGPKPIDGPVDFAVSASDYPTQTIRRNLVSNSHGFSTVELLLSKGSGPQPTFTPSPTNTRSPTATVIQAPTNTATPTVTPLALCPGSIGIRFTSIPTYGDRFGMIYGEVSGVKPADYRVAVYLLAYNGWYIKPFVGSFQGITNDCLFGADVTTGGIDEQATRFAAFLLPVGYSPPNFVLGNNLPSSLFNDSVANVIVDRPKP